MCTQRLPDNKAMKVTSRGNSLSNAATLADEKHETLYSSRIVVYSLKISSFYIRGFSNGLYVIRNHSWKVTVTYWEII